MKLQAKGTDEYVVLRNVPSEMAAAESRIVLGAFREACQGLLEMVTTAGKTEKVEKGVLANYIALQKLHKELSEELDHTGLILQIANEKFTLIGGEDA